MVHAAGIAYVCIADQTVLCIERGPYSSEPGVWCPPGGGIEPGETPLAAALREASEELGVDPEKLKGPEPIGHVSASNGFITFIAPVTLRWKKKLGRLDLDTDECSDAAWLPIDALPPDLHPGFAEILDQPVKREASEMEVDGRPSGPGVEYAPDRSYNTAFQFAGPNPGLTLNNLNPRDGLGAL